MNGIDFDLGPVSDQGYPLKGSRSLVRGHISGCSTFGKLVSEFIDILSGGIFLGPYSMFQSNHLPICLFARSRHQDRKDSRVITEIKR